jgi:Asp-tRNA(Asn)/Glu-tRNA(Gln) amidotransferase A subunit family amidase
MMSDQIDAFASAVDMLAALRARRVSAVELLEMHRRRIERHNSELNAIVEPDFDRARAEAADTHRARGEEAPLRGLPMTLKESINVRGLRTTAGMPMWKDFRSEHDAPVTLRVRGAGAVVMAKTNVPQNGAPVLEELGLFCAAVATLAGQPATAFPAGRTRGGLPIGLQVIGPYLEDRTPIRFADLLGREVGGFVRPPRYAAD